MLDMEMPNQEYQLWPRRRPGVYSRAAPALVMVGHWGLSFTVTPHGRPAVHRPHRRPGKRMNVRLRLFAALVALAAGAAAVVVASSLLRGRVFRRRSCSLRPLLVAARRPPRRACRRRPGERLPARPTVFVPPDAGIPPASGTQLTSFSPTRSAGGYAIRVALITTRYDMGSVTSSTASRSSTRTSSARSSLRLRGTAARRDAERLRRCAGSASRSRPSRRCSTSCLCPRRRTGPDWRALAARALRALAANAGVKIVPAPIVKAKSSGNTTTRDRLVIALVALVVLLGALGFGYFRKRR